MQSLEGLGLVHLGAHAPTLTVAEPVGATSVAYQPFDPGTPLNGPAMAAVIHPP